MLMEEKLFYQKLLINLDYYRKGVLLQLFNGDFPIIGEQPKVEVTSTELETPTKVESKEENSEDETTSLKKVRFINPMPSFVWKDMKVYGPYDKGVEIEIFSEVAELLIRKGRAEEI